MPGRPDLVYKGKGCKGFGDWLGTGNVPGGREGRKRKRTSDAEQDDHNKEEQDEEDGDGQEQEEQQQASQWQDEVILIVAENEFWEEINGTRVGAEEKGEDGLQVEVKVEHGKGYASLEV